MYELITIFKYYTTVKKVILPVSLTRGKITYSFIVTLSVAATGVLVLLFIDMLQPCRLKKCRHTFRQTMDTLHLYAIIYTSR